MGRKQTTEHVRCTIQIPVELNNLILRYKEETRHSKNEIIRQALKYFFNFHEVAVTDGQVAAAISASRPGEVVEREGFTVITAAYPNKLKFKEVIKWKKKNL